MGTVERWNETSIGGWGRWAEKQVLELGALMGVWGHVSLESLCYYCLKLGDPPLLPTPLSLKLLWRAQEVSVSCDWWVFFWIFSKVASR